MPKKQAEHDHHHHHHVGRRAPKGHFAVYVGSELRRFVVPTTYLKNPIFQQLLERAAEEYGFDHGHASIVLPIEISYFQSLMSFLAKSTS